MRNIRKKVISSKGETLAETLVAALIAALGLLLLASMIMNATHIVEKSQATMAKFYASVAEMEKKENSSKLPGETLLSVKEEVSGGSTIPIATIKINVYEADNGLISYDKNLN